MTLEALEEAGRFLVLTTPLGADKMLVTTLQVEERISGLFQISAEVLSHDAHPPATSRTRRPRR